MKRDQRLRHGLVALVFLGAIGSESLAVARRGAPNFSPPSTVRGRMELPVSTSGVSGKVSLLPQPRRTRGRVPGPGALLALHAVARRVTVDFPGQEYKITPVAAVCGPGAGERCVLAKVDWQTAGGQRKRIGFIASSESEAFSPATPIDGLGMPGTVAAMAGVMRRLGGEKGLDLATLRITPLHGTTQPGAGRATLDWQVGGKHGIGGVGGEVDLRRVGSRWAVTGVRETSALRDL